jgi:hypothetical protein
MCRHLPHQLHLLELLLERELDNWIVWEGGQPPGTEKGEFARYGRHVAPGLAPRSFFVVSAAYWGDASVLRRAPQWRGPRILILELGSFEYEWQRLPARVRPLGGSDPAQFPLWLLSDSLLLLRVAIPEVSQDDTGQGGHLLRERALDV